MMVKQDERIVEATEDLLACLADQLTFDERMTDADIPWAELAGRNPKLFEQKIIQLTHAYNEVVAYWNHDDPPPGVGV